MAYGGYSIVYPIVSFERAAPNWAEWMLGIEFFIAGILLISGLRKPKHRMLGLLVVCIGLSTISLSVAIVGGTRVLAYAFLFGAFAMQSVYDIREERRLHKSRKEQTEQLTAELIRLANDTRQGDS
jgi:CHASE2 domain-containing sensor protein